MKTILITGANGFIATNFVKQYKHKYRFIKLSHVTTAGHISFTELKENLDLCSEISVILNLAGANIANQRWSEKRKDELLASRIDTTRQLVDLFNHCERQPQLISASAIGIYDFDSTNDESTVINYSYYENFSQEITKQWEQEALQYLGKTVITRFGVVLSSHGGALNKMLIPFKLGFGGKLGTGNQGFPWIALDDLMSALTLIIDDCWTGVVNLNAPKHINNVELTKAIGKVWQRPTYINLPAFLIKILYGQMGEELLLNGNEVIPKRLIEAKFNYTYPDVISCLMAIKEQSR